MKKGGTKVDVIIRNISLSILKGLDEKAKESNVSRQNYLNGLLENQILITEINNREWNTKILKRRILK